jgi:ribosomal-protein-alanine N-acetyltransferase
MRPIDGVKVAGLSPRLRYATIDGVEVVGPSLRLRYATIDGVEVVGPSLRLRYATALDAPGLLELGSDPEVTRFFSWGPYVSASEPAAYIDGLAGERESGERLDFLIVGPDDEAIGVTGLSEFSRRDRRAVVGTWLGRSYWGTGANQSAKTLIAWLAFAVLGLERLGAYTDIENPRSQSALVGLGFVPEGTLRRWHRHGEHVHDVLLYSWLKQDWERSPLAQTRVSLRGRPPGIFYS